MQQHCTRSLIISQISWEDKNDIDYTLQGTGIKFLDAIAFLDFGYECEWDCIRHKVMFIASSRLLVLLLSPSLLQLIKKDI